MSAYIIRFPDGRTVGAARDFLDAKRTLDTNEAAPAGTAVVRVSDGVVLARKGAPLTGLAMQMQNNQAGSAGRWFE